MRQLTSVRNPEVKKVVALHDKKGRTEHRLFIVEGKRGIRSFLDAGWQPAELFMTHATSASVGNFFQPYTLVSDHVMQKMSTSTTPSGLLALFPLPAKQHPRALAPGLVMARISDAGNMGTLIRTAAAVGNRSIVVIEGCDPWSPKVVQASAGALSLLSVIELTWQDLVAEKGSLALCALVITGGKPPEELNLSSALLVVGNEAHGIPPEWLAQCDARLTLPMPGNTESLNAAVAGSIALYLQYRPCSKTR